jgi:formyl-CoA transferase
MLCTTPEMWQALCNIIGHPEVPEDPRFKDRKEREKYIEELSRLIEEWTSQHSKHEVMKVMGEAGVPCGAVLDSVELLNDPHLKERGMVVTVDHPVRGKFSMPGCPVKLEDSPAEVKSAPLLGQHNAEIYGQMLGLNGSDLEQLKQQGVI